MQRDLPAGKAEAEDVVFGQKCFPGAASGGGSQSTNLKTILELQRLGKLRVIAGIRGPVVYSVHPAHYFDMPLQLRHETQVQRAPCEAEALSDKVHVGILSSCGGGCRIQRRQVLSQRGERAVVATRGCDKNGVLPDQRRLGFVIEEGFRELEQDCTKVQQESVGRHLQYRVEDRGEAVQ